MSPQEASEVMLEEPDWREVFENECLRWPRLPRHLQEDNAFESVLKKWRHFHMTNDASAGMVALATLHIFPPRWLIKDEPRDGKCFQEQHDEHCWITMSQRAWRIVTIEDRIMLCDSFGEQTQIDLATAKWGKYLDKAVEAMEARREVQP